MTPIPSPYLFVIPARGGSKGVPGKNLRTVGGVCLVGRAIRTAKETVARLGGAGHQVICSTDSREIAEVAKEWGAEVPFLRPEHLADDNASTIDVVFHLLDVLTQPFDAVVLMQPTSPLTRVDDVLGAIALFEREHVPVVSVCPNTHPLEWTYWIDEMNHLEPVLAQQKAHQRQQSKRSFRLNGAVYVASPDFLRQYGGFMAESTQAFIMPIERSIDIDTEFDLLMADVLANNPEANQTGADRPEPKAP